MKFCQYTYCREVYQDDRDSCPVCGYPADASLLKDNDFVDHILPDLPVKSIIDMHQIIPAKEGMLQQQLRMMEKLGIKEVLLQSVPSKVTSIWGNRKLLEVKQKHGDKFMISHFMDPRYPLALKRLKQYREKGVRVIKLLPCLGYQPDSPRWRRFWKRMDELNLVAMIHTGFITASHKDEERRSGVYLHSKYGRPIFFDILARKYPNIQFILCHMGGTMWVEEAVQMVNAHENVWGDISGSGIGALKRIIHNHITVDWTKLFWGNDSPPALYPVNLKLLFHYLKTGNLLDMAPMLLHDNAKHFRETIYREHLT